MDYKADMKSTSTILLLEDVHVEKLASSPGRFLIREGEGKKRPTAFPRFWVIRTVYFHDLPHPSGPTTTLKTLCSSNILEGSLIH